MLATLQQRNLEVFTVFEGCMVLKLYALTVSRHSCLRCQIFRRARRRPDIASHVSVCKVGIYSLYVYLFNVFEKFASPIS